MPPLWLAMILDQVNLVVSDMEATVDFYELLGLEFPDTAPEWQGHHRTVTMPSGIALDFDSMEFAKIWNRGTTPQPGGTGSVIGFRVESREHVDALYSRATTAGYRGQQEPYDAFWGARYAVLEDPDGQPIGIMSPIDQSRREPPPATPSARAE
ncbi:MAG: VOC family protein [Actinobacteria bacterium]|nr:VOC family protein [Actinomycetota bacterium]